MKPLEAHAVILAGGRGTRFWPRSRLRQPKQLLNIVGGETMLEQTVARLAPLVPPSRLWVVTNAEQAALVRAQLPRLPAAQLLIEPCGRNTAAAIALAATHLRARLGDALMAVLPADHVIGRPARYRQIARAALTLAREPGRMIVLGIRPRRAETGYGYIERGRQVARAFGDAAFAVRRFTEKPNPARARRFLASGRHFWNAGMFFWRVSTYLDQLRELLPATARAFDRLGGEIGRTGPRRRRPTENLYAGAGYRRLLARTYRHLENISVDYAVLEPASRAPGRPRVLVLPAEFGWSDIGSWASVYELLARGPGENLSAGPLIAREARGNYFWVPGKLAAAIGVDELVVVETEDALLVCRRDRAQEVGRVVKELEKRKLRGLL
jgi:mannose-1-phosphate guanylyltransferase